MTHYGANVHANGIRQHYLYFGMDQAKATTTQNLIIIPGITSPAITWAFVGTQLGRHFNTYIVDVRGRGLSEQSEQLDYGVDAQAKDVIDFTAQLGLKNFILLGHSMGARIAARAARQQLPGLERLILVDPPVSGPDRRPYPANLSWYVDSMKAARKGCSAEDIRAYCPSWTDEQLALRAEWLHTCDERAVIESFNDFHTEDFHSDLPSLHIPTLLMRAEHGDVIRDEDVQEITSLAPSITAVCVANAGHMIPWDNEAGFYAALGEFLNVDFTS